MDSKLGKWIDAGTGSNLAKVVRGCSSLSEAAEAMKVASGAAQVPESVARSAFLWALADLAGEREGLELDCSCDPAYPCGECGWGRVREIRAEAGQLLRALGEDPDAYREPIRAIRTLGLAAFESVRAVASGEVGYSCGDMTELDPTPAFLALARWHFERQGRGGYKRARVVAGWVWVDAGRDALVSRVEAWKGERAWRSSVQELRSFHQVVMRGSDLPDGNRATVGQVLADVRGNGAKVRRWSVRGETVVLEVE